MTEKPIRNELHISIGSTTYKACSINTKLHGEEFFYQFSYPSNLKKHKVLNYNTKSITYRPDHISYHKEGHAHLKFKEDDTKHCIANTPDKTLLPFNENILTPLLIHSIFEHQNTYMLPIAEETKSDSTVNVISYNLPSSIRNFSIILLLSPANRTPAEVLKHPVILLNANKTAHIGLLGNQIIRILAWEEWVIDCIITYLTLPLYNSPFDQVYQAFAYSNLQIPIENLIKQRFNKIHSNRILNEIGEMSVMELLYFTKELNNTFSR